MKFKNWVVEVLFNSIYMRIKKRVDNLLYNSLFWFLLLGVLIFLFYFYQENIINYLDSKDVVGKKDTVRKIEKLKFISLFFTAAYTIWLVFLAKKSKEQNLKFKDWFDKIFYNSLFWFILILILIVLFYIFNEDIFEYLDHSKPVGKIEKLKFIGLFFAAIIALWQVFLANKRTEQTDKTIEISLNNSVDERFKDAIELLGSDKVQTRLGAIYALHHLAIVPSKKDKSYTKSVFEILCSYIREKTNEVDYINKYVDTKNNNCNPSIEIQTIIDLLFRIETDPYSLFHAKLNNAKLVGVNLNSAKLNNANLKNAILENADLKFASLSNTNLEHANLNSADFESAFLVNVNMDGIIPNVSELKNIKLRKINNRWYYP